jgi:dihydrofolate reductase
LKDYLESATFEHTFWLRVLSDHATFIHDSLYPSEERDITKAKEFITTFRSLLEESKQLSNNNVIAFTKKAETAAENIREFKLSIIRRHLTGDIGIHLSPTFINHMLNELEEYILVISYLKEGKAAPIFHELHHHLLWLADASGHAGAIHDELDGVEKRLKEKSQAFTKHFDAFYLKAIELTGYLRANVTSFPALKRFNNDVEVEMNLFRVFLHEIEEMELSDTVLSTFSALMADHMYREECYYLMKLAESTNSELPDCDPTK